MATANPKWTFGWTRDRPDPRDFLYGAPAPLLLSLPARVDLRGPDMPPVYDQGRIGSCTANAIAAAVQFDRSKLGETPDFAPSRLFIYYQERLLEHHVPYDAGGMLRDGIKSLRAQGVCPETTWPYDDTPADELTHRFPPHSRAVVAPDPAACSAARQHTAIAYLRVTQTLAQLRGCLAEGFPFVFGIQVFPGFFDAGTGRPLAEVPMPSWSERQSPPDGWPKGHAVVGVGYDNAAGVFFCRNSWGSDVQDRGYFRLPYGYVADPELANDFWTLRRMKS